MNQSPRTVPDLANTVFIGHSWLRPYRGGRPARPFGGQKRPEVYSSRPVQCKGRGPWSHAGSLMRRYRLPAIAPYNQRPADYGVRPRLCDSAHRRRRPCTASRLRAGRRGLRRRPGACPERRPPAPDRAGARARVGRTHARESRRRNRRPGALPRPGPGRALASHPRLAAARPRAKRPITWPGARRACGSSASRPSLLNPLWYAGSFAIGALAALFGDRASLGFVAETERQVEGHLDEHLRRLPASDTRSRAMWRPCEPMRSRMAQRGACAAGAVELPRHRASGTDAGTQGHDAGRLLDLTSLGSSSGLCIKT